MASPRSLLTGGLLVAVGVALLLTEVPRAQEAEAGAPDRPGPTARISASAAGAAVARVWHGKTPREKADEYERYLTGAVKKFPAIKGNLGYQVLRLDGGPDGAEYVEFQVISYWASLDAIRAYAGDDIRKTRDLPRDPEFLVAMEPQVRNYQLRVNAIGQ
jgi:heme-degrading monooxygenase HmoA